jgi:hypothetical protein
MKLLHPILSLLVASVLIFPYGGVLYAQTIFVADSDSRLWIEGRSNINQFDCIANEYSGQAIVTNTAVTKNENTEFRNELDINVEILVDGFECGRNRMNRDLKDALKSDQYPKIIFEYEDAEILSIPEYESDSYRMLVSGDLTVAGVTRRIEFETNGLYRNDGRMEAMGKKEIKMTDYNVVPPSGLFGLVKAQDELTVHFDIIAIPKQKENEQP